MGRIYAGILGPVAFLTSLANGAIHGGTVESTLLVAWCSLLAFTVIGYVIGWIAGWIIEDSVKAAVSAQLAEQQQADSAATVS